MIDDGDVSRELRELVRHRAKLVALRSSLTCQVHAVLAACGVPVVMSDLFGAGGQALLARVVLPRTRRPSPPLVVADAADTPEEAVAVANRVRYGLTSAILAGDTYRAFELAPQILHGIVNVNSPTVNDEIHAPMGGVRDSGWGRTGTTPRTSSSPDRLNLAGEILEVPSLSSRAAQPSTVAVSVPWCLMWAPGRVVWRSQWVEMLRGRPRGLVAEALHRWVVTAGRSARNDLDRRDTAGDAAHTTETLAGGSHR